MASRLYPLFVVLFPFVLGSSVPGATTGPSPESGFNEDASRGTPLRSELHAPSPPASLPWGWTEVREQLRQRLEARNRTPGPIRVGDEPIRAESTLVRFYEDRTYQPAWTNDEGLLPQADSLRAALQRTDRHGLSPADYHTEALDQLFTTFNASREAERRGNAALLASIDLALTDAFVVYGLHLLRGHVDPLSIEPQWTATPRRADLVRALNRALQTADVEGVLESLAPPSPDYRGLQRAYAIYRRIDATGGWPSLPEGETIDPGAHDRRVPILRARLLATSDLAPDGPPARDSVGSVTYDSLLVDAVRTFQRRHGLADDGVIGTKTREALNVSAAERLRQIRVNLERRRWLPDDLGARHVLVNVAGFDLQLVDDDTTTLRMRVVTGTPYRQTPVFSDAIRYLVLSPYWHVPVKLAVEDKLPAVQNDPSYFRRQHIRVFEGWGADAREVNPDSVDWSSVSPERFPYRLRQDPGAYNALGRIKFMFPNPHDVYLHDTPTRGLFSQSSRAFSSGCIRLEQPFELAARLLDGQTSRGEAWTVDRLREALDEGQPRTLWLKSPVPVHLLYRTAWVEDDVVHFRADVYDRDPALADALNDDGAP